MTTSRQWYGSCTGFRLAKAGGIQDGHLDLPFVVRHNSGLPGQWVSAVVWRRSSSAAFCRQDTPFLTIRDFLSRPLPRWGGDTPHSLGAPPVSTHRPSEVFTRPYIIIIITISQVDRGCHPLRESVGRAGSKQLTTHSGRYSSVPLYNWTEANRCSVWRQHSCRRDMKLVDNRSAICCIAGQLHVRLNTWLQSHTVTCLRTHVCSNTWIYHLPFTGCTFERLIIVYMLTKPIMSFKNFSLIWLIYFKNYRFFTPSALHIRPIERGVLWHQCKH